MDNFKKALAYVLKWEGGYKLHKNPTEDYYTFAGIYQGAYPSWEGWKYIEAGDLNKAIQLVEDFYRINFWNIIKGDYLPFKIAVALFDTAVNVGHRKAIKFLQKTLKKDFKKNIVVDGILGKQTISAIEEIEDVDRLLLYFLKRRAIYYAKLPDKYSIYKKGWLNRTFDLIENFYRKEME